MDFQFYGANCIVVSSKGIRIVIDDMLASFGAKSILKETDVALYTQHEHPLPKVRLLFDDPGEYEVADISIVGIPARAHMDEASKKYGTTMYKLVIGDTSVLITGHIHPDINDTLLEKIGVIDVLFIPVGGSGYTLDPIGALKIIKEIEPKIVIPTNYADPGLAYPVPQVELTTALKELAMEPKEHTTKLRLKPTDLTDTVQLIVLEKA